jgi:hypothetical protein
VLPDPEKTRLFGEDTEYFLGHVLAGLRVLSGDEVPPSGRCEVLIRVPWALRKPSAPLPNYATD